MKFRNRTTGIILKPKSEEVIEQLRKNTDYEEVKMVVVKDFEEKETSKKSK